MNAETISAISGVILSLMFAYVPHIKDWFAGLDGTYKRLVMALVLLVAAGGSLLLSCWEILDLVSCDKVGIVALVQAYIAALVTNQATYSLAVRPSQPEVV